MFDTKITKDMMEKSIFKHGKNLNSIFNEFFLLPIILMNYYNWQFNMISFIKYKYKET